MFVPERLQKDFLKKKLHLMLNIISFGATTYRFATHGQLIKNRFESSTGGLLNGLSIYLLESKKVNLLCIQLLIQKTMRSLSKFSYSKEELLSGESRSRYGPAGTLERFHEALDLNEPFAFVGKTLRYQCNQTIIKK